MACRGPMLQEARFGATRSGRRLGRHRSSSEFAGRGPEGTFGIHDCGATCGALRCRRLSHLVREGHFQADRGVKLYHEALEREL